RLYEEQGKKDKTEEERKKWEETKKRRGAEPAAARSPRERSPSLVLRPGSRSSSRGEVDGAADLVEGAVGAGAEHADGGDADHDDQSQHDRVLDRRRAVFVFQEGHEARS